MKNNHRTILICRGTGCTSSKSPEIQAALQENLEGVDVEVKFTGCHGMCQQGPIVIIEPEDIFYAKVKTEDAQRIVDHHITKGEMVEDLFYQDPGTKDRYPNYHAIPFYSRQKRLVLQNCGKINPEEIEDSLAVGRYQGLEKALGMSPLDIVTEVKNSGLRGRGGGGFSTGMKWQFCQSADGDPKYVLCNADEGDPGAFMDRSVLEGDPHAVLEGMIIAGFAIGARQGYIYCRAEYPLAIKRLQIAIEQAREKGFLGENILGSKFSFDIEIFQGAGAFVCGEETALITSIEGNRGMPRSRPPYPANSGLYGKPTLLNNVKTYANIPLIITNGSKWFADIGTENSKGTAVFALTGKIANSGLIEVPMGVTLREIIYDIGGGVLDGKKFKAVQTGGPSGGCLPESFLDTPVDYDSLIEAGSMMGSGGMVVLDEDTCMVDVARYFLEFTEKESCGKCVPCRLGTKEMLTILTDITEGRGKPGDIELLQEIGESVKRGSLCGLGQTAPNPVLTTIRYFRNEYEDHIYKKRCTASICPELVSSPCQAACPIDTEASVYISLIAQERFEEAFEVILKDNPLPTVCGRVCDAPCEDKCKAGEGVGTPVAIRELKRFVTDYAIERGIYPIPGIKPSLVGEKVAIIGSGPSGLTAGYYLALNGYDVTIYEEAETPGGALAGVIPKYRLPTDKFLVDLENIKNKGVKIKTNTKIGVDIPFKRIRSQYKAVFVATGAHKSKHLNIPNENAKGVLHALDFLKKVNTDQPVSLGKRVGVIGGGNAAVDSARVALRNKDCEEVFLIYRRTQKEMPAFEEEVKDLIEEGVSLHFLTAPKSILLANDNISGLECIKMELGEVDKSGRRRPIPVEGSEFVIDLDTLIVAIGEEPDPSLFKDIKDIRIADWGAILAQPETLQTGVEGVFAGGDAVTGPATVIEAIAAGKLAAEMIDKYLKGEGLEREYKLLRPSTYIEPVMLDDEVDEVTRLEPLLLPVKQRIHSFEEVVTTFSKSQAITEAQRCLRCDLATEDGRKALEVIQQSRRDE